MFHRMMNYGELEARPSVILTRDLIKKLMPKFRRHDDMVIIQERHWEDFKRSIPLAVTRDKNSPYSIDEDELASLVCQTIHRIQCRRLAVEKPISPDEYLKPNMEMILGDHGIICLKDNQISYKFDITKCPFAMNAACEKARLSDLNCSDEIVVDLFAGMGYYSLALLMSAKAKHLYACESNSNAVEALKKNLVLNDIDEDRFTVIEGDNRSNRPTDVAQRVILAILPSSLDWMETAFDCVDKSTGAILHCHELVEVKSASRSPSQSVTDKQTASNNSSDAGSSSFDKLSPMCQTFLNNSLSSSSSSHSTIEKLSAPGDEKAQQSSESDKDGSSPVMVEKSPTGSPAGPTAKTPPFNDHSRSPSDSCNLLETLSTSSNHGDSISNNEQPQPQLSEQDLIAHEARAQALIARIKDDVEAHDLSISLSNVQPVAVHAPNVHHVVFDIKIEPAVASAPGRPLRCSSRPVFSASPAAAIPTIDSNRASRQAR